jgi:hypothetical protein
MRFVCGVLGLAIALVCSASALAQLPADAVQLDKVKIAEKLKSVDFDPVYLEKADPQLPTWEHKGVQYGSSKPDAKEKFLADPDTFAKAAEKQRFINNFMQSMSTIWCPVTDEVTPGGMLQWERFGLTFESCCSFCDESFQESDFENGLKKLKERAEKTYALIGAKYTENAKSPVEGAIKMPEDEK